MVHPGAQQSWSSGARGAWCMRSSCWQARMAASITMAGERAHMTERLFFAFVVVVEGSLYGRSQLVSNPCSQVNYG
jgi:hypothetical protein